MEAIIFDMDGTLIDSEKVHSKCYFIYMKNLGIDFDEEEFKEFLIENQGAPDSSFVKKLIKKYGLKNSLKEIVAAKNACYRKLIASDVFAFDGAVDLVKGLKVKYKLALASSSDMEDIEACMKKIGLFDTFDVIVSGSELKNPKPAPDIFLLTAKKLGVDIKDCLIFEDSLMGLEAAKKSGAKVIAYDNKEGDNSYIRNFFVVDDYKKVNVENVIKKLEEI